MAPMSTPKKQNTLLAGNNSGPLLPAAKAEILAMKYVMERPVGGIYPLSDDTSAKSYPDYMPWQEDDTQNERLNNADSLNNGFFESPLVANEYFSGRNLIQKTLFSSPQSCTAILKELSTNLTKSYRTRNEIINKISSELSTFKLPPRVTLTASKRDLWLRDLANPEIPLARVATKIPHGIRNKILIDCMCMMSVPIARALWFTRCVLYTEHSLLRKKFQSKSNTLSQQLAQSSHVLLEAVGARWLKEWTLQVADYMLKFAREMLSVNLADKRLAYQQKLGYLLAFLNTLYIEGLLDRPVFLTAIIGFLRDDLPLTIDDLPELLEVAQDDSDDSAALANLLQRSHLNYGQLLLGVTLIRTYWLDIISEDFLCKQLSESLLLVYFLLEKVSDANPESAKPSSTMSTLPAIHNDLQRLISSSIVELFKHNTNYFIIPDYWALIGEVLYRVLVQCHVAKGLNKAMESALRLINFRNESLMLNLRYHHGNDRNLPSSGIFSDRRSSFLLPGVRPEKVLQQTKTSVDANSALFNRPVDDNLRFIDQLDKLNLNSVVVSQLRPKARETPGLGWRMKLKVLVFWCVSAYRDLRLSPENVLIVSNFIKLRILQPITTRGSAQLKADFENEVFESIFALADEPESSIHKTNLIVLVNELFQLKILSLSSYLRKIIACGILYISSHEDANKKRDSKINFHLMVLLNLPSFNNKQYSQILKRWTTEYLELSRKYDLGISLVSENVLRALEVNAFSDQYESFIVQFDSLDVGLKFQVAGWLTSQMKQMITKSPKLISLLASTVANIYRVYLCANNLTMFFKGFIRFVLKNENKVIIYYLDTLYFISRLIQHHFSLIKSIPGPNSASLPLSHELFSLILQSYNDLHSRESDIYRFRDMWQFMEIIVEKESGKLYTKNNSTKAAFDKIIFSKDTVESPIKTISHDTRRGPNFDPSNFVAELKRLIEKEPNNLGADEILDTLSVLKDTSLLQEIESHRSEEKIRVELPKLLKAWCELSEDIGFEANSAFARLFEHYRRVLRSDRKNLYNLVVDSISRVIAQVQSGPFIAFLRNFLSVEAFLISEIVLLLEEVSNNLLNCRSEDILLDLLLNDVPLSHHMPPAQNVLLKMIRDEYLGKNTQHAANLLLVRLQLLSNEGFAERLQLCLLCLRLIQASLTSHTLWAVPTFSNVLLKTQVVLLSDSLLGTNIHNDDSPSLKDLSPYINEFSLPIFQLLIASGVFTTESEPLNENLNDLLVSLRFPLDPYNSYFGEVFKFMNKLDKRQVFESLENLILTKVTLLSPMNTSDTDDVPSLCVLLKLLDDDTDVLPVLRDFFKKFSVSCSEYLVTLLESFKLYANLLEQILFVLNDWGRGSDQSLDNLLTIFLRLLIIHNNSMIEIISKTDTTEFAFLRNLVALSNTAYMSQNHEKLRILLCDLLLLMKSSLTQLWTTDPSNGANPSYQADKSASEDDGEGKNNLTTLDTVESNLATINAMISVLDMPEPASCELHFIEEPNDDVVRLDRAELLGGDITFVNRQLWDSTPKNLEAMGKPLQGATQPNAGGIVEMSSIHLIEDTTQELNNGCLSLSMFDAYVTRENPY